MFNLIGFLWGFLEATIFFIVPDVYLTGVVLKANNKKTFEVFLYCLFGAALGGALVYYFACIYSSQTLSWLGWIPGISGKLIQDVRLSIASQGLLTMFQGMFQGVPYKLFAAAWGEKGGNFLSFILLSVLARGSRFLVSMLATVFLRDLGIKIFKIKNWNIWQWVIYCIFWLVVYSVYFYFYGW